MKLNIVTQFKNSDELQLALVSANAAILLAEVGDYRLYAARNKYAHGFCVYLKRGDQKYQIMGCQHTYQLPLEKIVPDAEAYIARFFETPAMSYIPAYLVLSIKDLRRMIKEIQTESRSGASHIRSGLATKCWDLVIDTNMEHNVGGHFQAQVSNRETEPQE